MLPLVAAAILWLRWWSRRSKHCYFIRGSPISLACAFSSSFDCITWHSRGCALFFTSFAATSSGSSAAGVSLQLLVFPFVIKCFVASFLTAAPSTVLLPHSPSPAMSYEVYLLYCYVRGHLHTAGVFSSDSVMMCTSMSQHNVTTPTRHCWCWVNTFLMSLSHASSSPSVALSLRSYILVVAAADSAVAGFVVSVSLRCVTRSRRWALDLLSLCTTTTHSQNCAKCARLDKLVTLSFCPLCFWFFGH